MASGVLAFDTSIGTNFTNTACPDFFASFTANKTFNDCHPVSFYLQNSQSYIRAIRQGGLNGTEQIIDAACSADLNQCNNIMTDLDNQLMKSCQQDYNQENPLVVQAHNDFMSYPIIYKATCLPTHEVNTTANFCYTDSLFGPNASNELDAYLYLLPLGIDFPGSGSANGSSTLLTTSGTPMKASCSDCTRQVMNIFHSYTNNSQLPITNTYNPAAVAIDQSCQANFVNATIEFEPTKHSSKSLAPFGVRQGCTMEALPKILSAMVVFNIALSIVG